MSTPSPLRVVLGSASPARLATLQRAGLAPEVMVSGFDEDTVDADRPEALVEALAAGKAEAVWQRLHGAGTPDTDVLVIGCDSVLELDGDTLGKPHTPEVAAARWRAMRGRTGVLHTGHAVRLHRRDGNSARAGRVVSTTVQFAELTDAEIEAYVASGEPLQAAGAFTIDGLGGAFITAIDGDHHNVVGISLPAMRDLVSQVGLRWTDLWSPT